MQRRLRRRMGLILWMVAFAAAAYTYGRLAQNGRLPRETAAWATIPLVVTGIGLWSSTNIGLWSSARNRSVQAAACSGMVIGFVLIGLGSIGAWFIPTAAAAVSAVMVEPAGTWTESLRRVLWYAEGAAFICFVNFLYWKRQEFDVMKSGLMMGVRVETNVIQNYGAACFVLLTVVIAIAWTARKIRAGYLHPLVRL
jgi:hypothetical protein